MRLSFIARFYLICFLLYDRFDDLWLNEIWFYRLITMSQKFNDVFLRRWRIIAFNSFYCLRRCPVQTEWYTELAYFNLLTAINAGVHQNGHARNIRTSTPLEDNLSCARQKRIVDIWGQFWPSIPLTWAVITQDPISCCISLTHKRTHTYLQAYT